MLHNSKGLYRLMWDTSKEQGLAKEEHQGPHHDLRAEQQPKTVIPPVLNVLAMHISTILWLCAIKGVFTRLGLVRT